MKKRRFQPHFNRGLGGVFAHNLGLAHLELPFWDSLIARKVTAKPRMYLHRMGIDQNAKPRMYLHRMGIDQNAKPRMYLHRMGVDQNAKPRMYLQIVLDFYFEVGYLYS
jgi:hypothetical protein